MVTAHRAFAFSLFAASLCFVAISSGEQPPGAAATEMPAPTILLGNNDCAGSQQCLTDEIDGKLGVTLSWKPCAGAKCAQRPTHWAVYRSLPPPRPGTRADPPPAGFETPVVTGETPKGWSVLELLPTMFVPSFKPGDCFVARAFLGPIDGRSPSPSSPAGTPVCVDASTKVGTDVLTIVPVSAPGNNPAFGTSGENGCQVQTGKSSPSAKQIGTYTFSCPKGPPDNGKTTIERDWLTLSYSVPWRGLMVAEVDLVIPHGAQCATSVDARWGFSTSGVSNFATPVETLPIGQHGDSVTINLNAALPGFIRQNLVCYTQICDLTAWVNVTVAPDMKSTATCVSVVTEAPQLRIRKVKY